MAVKVAMADGGHIEYKSKDGVFEAVSPIIQERLKLALVAQCHQGTFFEDVGHLADGFAAQQCLDGTYEYPSVVSRLDMYRTKVLMYRKMVLMAHSTKVRH